MHNNVNVLIITKPHTQKIIKGRHWEKGRHCPPFADPDDSTRLQWIVPISWLNRVALLKSNSTTKQNPKDMGLGKGRRDEGGGC